MTKTFTAAEIRSMANALLPSWESEKHNLKVDAKTMYGIIKIKKQLEKHIVDLQETISTIAERYGGEPTQNGGYKIPDDKIEEVNKCLEGLNEQEIEIDYTPIMVKDSDSIPSSVMEVIFDFVEIQ